MKRIFVNGTFDVLHIGHIKLLNYAKSRGDWLLVALDSDERVKLKKGNSRPINDLTTRLTLISNLKAVDEVASFSSDAELSSLIQTYYPNLMIVGSDWRGKPIIGQEHARNIEFFERIGTYSSTNTIDKFLSEKF